MIAECEKIRNFRTLAIAAYMKQYKQKREHIFQHTMFGNPPEFGIQWYHASIIMTTGLSTVF